MNISSINHKETLRFDHLYDKTPSGEDFFFHFHNDYEFLYFIGGNANFVIENKVYSLKKNDFLVIRPAQRHKLCLLSPIPYERCVFNFKKSNLSSDEISFLKNAGSVYHIEKDSVTAKVLEVLTAAGKFYSAEDFEKLKLMSLHSIITDIKYLTKSKEYTLKSSLIDKMTEYIDNHIGSPLTSLILAEAFFISRSSVDREFQSELHTSCQQYIIRRRIIYAQSLIMLGIPATKVAEMCSYVNYTTFYRQYKSVLGVPPIQDKLDTATKK